MKNHAIIVGRFQVHELQEGQLEMIQGVINTHDTVTIVLGLANQKGTVINPLDFQARKKMISTVFPKVSIRYIEDDRGDTIWSHKLDSQIKVWHKTGTITVFGSSEGFINHYKGEFDYEALDSRAYTSPSEILRQIKAAKNDNLDFRMGVIYGTSFRFPTAYQTVDVAIFNEDGTELLMARKPNREKWQFVGGFSEPTSPSLEADARKEVMEEANVDITDPVYIGSTLIDDSRYAGEQDKIKTALFVCKYLCGKPQGGDDIAEVKWFKVENLDPLNVARLHLTLLEKVKAWKEENTI